MNYSPVALNVAEKPSVAKKVTELLNKNQLNRVYSLLIRSNPFLSLTLYFSSIFLLEILFIQCDLPLSEDIS